MECGLTQGEHLHMHIARITLDPDGLIQDRAWLELKWYGQFTAEKEKEGGNA